MKIRKAAAILFALLFVLSLAENFSAAEGAGISPGLQNLTSGRYAKIYTLQNMRYYNSLYSDKNLSAPLSSSAWTGMDDEIWLMGVGTNSYGRVYAYISYPLGSGGSRRSAYADLRAMLVAGTLDGSARRAANSHYGMYKRRNSGRNTSYGIDAGDSVYLLTQDNGWCQVLYPSGSLWRIAWMTQSEYDGLFSSAPDPTPSGGAGRDAAVAHAEEILNYTWNTSDYILLYYRGYAPSGSGFPTFNGSLPIVVTGRVKGIPYSLSANGNGAEKTFAQYKALSASDKREISGIYTYSGGSRVSMKYGMSCATFVSDSILHGLTGKGLSVGHVTTFHTNSGWRNYVTQGTMNTAGYRKLQKGDYVRNGGHVMLVAGNNSSSVTVIEQTTPDSSPNATITSTTLANARRASVPLYKNGTAKYYTAIILDGYSKSAMGTRKRDVSYSTLLSEGYYPMYVNYPSTPTPTAKVRITDVPSAQVAAGANYYYQCKADGTVSSWNTSSGTIPSGMETYSKNTLPSGLSINSSTGEISGTISHTSQGALQYQPMRYYFNVTGSNADPKSAFIAVYEPPAITTNASLASAKVNQYYEQAITAEGTEWSMAWRKLSGSLPSGMELDMRSSKRTVTLKGTPRTAGTYTFTLECSNFVGNSDTTTTKTFTLSVGGGGEWRDSNMSIYYTLKSGRESEYYSDWVRVDGLGSNSLASARISSGSLPSGMSLYVSSKYIYVRGTPAASGTFTFTIRAVGSHGGYAEKNLSINVQSPTTQPEIVYTLRNGKTGEYYSDYVEVRGGTPPFDVYCYKLGVGWDSSCLPSGLNVSTGGSDGRRIYIKGTPSRAGTYDFTIGVVDRHSWTEATKDLSITIAENYAYSSAGADQDYDADPAKPKIITKKLPKVSAGSELTAALEAVGTQPITWTLESGTLPEGFNFSDSGVITGIPLEAGKYKFKVTASNSEGSASKSYTLKVVPAKPVITTQGLPDGVVGESYDVDFEAAGTEPIKWSKSGSLPKGLKLDKTTGKLSGVPTKEGTYTFKVQAKNKGGKHKAEMQIVIHASAEAGKEAVSTSGAVMTSAVTVNNGTSENLTGLSLIDGDEEIFGAAEVEVGRALTFELDEWIDEYGDDAEVSGVQVMIDGHAAAGITVAEDGTFTIPAEMVSGTFTVSVRAQTDEGVELRSEEIIISTTEQENDAEPYADASSGECNAGFAGITLMLLCGTVLLKKK